jgi:hypothetical protein
MHRFVMVGAALLAGCASGAPSFREAESLEGQGKLEEAAGKFELVCAESPKSAECASADSRASGARAKAGIKAIEEGQVRKGVRLMRLAMLAGEEQDSKMVAERLAKDDVVQGLRFEDAAADPDKPKAVSAMEGVAASGTPAAEKAKAWLARERPATLVTEVKAACGPSREGSCLKAWAALWGLASKPAGFEEARAVYEAEQKRVAAPRGEAERFLVVFAQRGQKQKVYDECLAKPSESEPLQHAAECRTEAWDKASYERFDAERNDDGLFRRRLTAVGDPEFIAVMNARRKEALETGIYKKPEAQKPSGGVK